MSRKKTFKLCFLTMCFDINCSCVEAKKDTCTSLSNSTDKNNTLRTSDTSLNCMIFNRRINEANHELEKTTQDIQTDDVKDDVVSPPNEALTEMRGMPRRFMIG